MQLGVGAAALLVLGAGTFVFRESGLHGGRLTPTGRLILSRVGEALLDGVLPAEPAQRRAALDAFIVRVDAVIAALAPHAQQELAQLLALLATAVGRRGLAGLAGSWQAASLLQVQAALDGMRTSPLSLRVQAYQALHDISGAAFFSDRSSWAVLGYPGPVQV